MELFCSKWEQNKGDVLRKKLPFGSVPEYLGSYTNQGDAGGGNPWKDAFRRSKTVFDHHY